MRRPRLRSAWILRLLSAGESYVGPGRTHKERRASAMSQHYSVTAGIDLGDRYTHVCLLDTENGQVIEESRIPTSPKAFQRRFSGTTSMRIAIETGTHSPWVSRLLEECGHQILVANARKVR